MKSTIKISLFSTALAFLALPAVAQNSATSTAQTIQQRKENQQDRIAQGVKSGELTAGETTNLEKKRQISTKKSTPWRTPTTAS